MEAKHLNVAFFFLLLAAVGVVVFFIFQSFLTAIVAAAILSALFKKPYHVLEKWTHGRKGTSALLTCLLVVVIIVTPLFIVLSLAIGEAENLYHELGQESTLQKSVSSTVASIQNIPGIGTFVDIQAFDQERILSDLKQFSQN